MSDSQLRIKVNRIIIQSGFEKSADLLSPIVKIINMRYSNIQRDQVLRVTNAALL